MWMFGFLLIEVSKVKFNRVFIKPYRTHNCDGRYLQSLREVHLFPGQLNKTLLFTIGNSICKKHFLNDIHYFSGVLYL